MPGVLPDLDAAELRVREDILMEDKQVTIRATVEFKVSHCLNADVIEELVVECLEGKVFFPDLALVLHLLVINVLEVVVDEAVAVGPEVRWGDDNEAMSELLFLAWRRYRLQDEVIPDVPDYHFILLIHSEHERALLAHPHISYWLPMALQAA